MAAKNGIILLIGLLHLAACQTPHSQNKDKMSGNKLIYETSPYLLQHANNPVKWYPWGDSAFEKARKEDKLILVSIGYSACHWCHVMEHESFEDIEVANLMNAHFVCIKVDREERPDVDQIYMEAVQMLSGRGGWPLNCFALPDGCPVWGGTYFSKGQWMDVLKSLNGLYTNERQKLLDQAKQLTDGINQQDFPQLAALPQKADKQLIQKNSAARFDLKYGGFGGAPKFPMPVALNLVHQIAYVNQDQEQLDFVYLTLDKMASGGIYDQAGGGFARYSVDERWFAPHFEKMLYDNAQLVSLYSKAYKTSGNLNYKRIVEETFDFLNREMTSAEGAYYSALDADSEGVEGKFYTWTNEELKSILGDDEHFFRYFGIKEHGNWEHNVNILHGNISREAYAELSSLNADVFNKNITESLIKLMKAREARIRPGLDDKILTAWNALMISGLCDAYQAFGDEKYLSGAQKAMKYLLNNVKQNDGSLHRSSKNGVSKIDGFLDDYAFAIEALIMLYQVTFDAEYLQEAKSFKEYVMRNFYDEGNGIFYYTSEKGEKLIARKTDIQDNVIPSSVGTMAKNLIQLSQFNHELESETIAELLISKMTGQAEKHPGYYARWASLVVLQDSRQEIAICGSQAEIFRKKLQLQFIPGAVYAGSDDEENNIELLSNRWQDNQTLIYKCKNKACDLPVTAPNELKISYSN